METLQQGVNWKFSSKYQSLETAQNIEAAVSACFCAIVIGASSAKVHCVDNEAETSVQIVLVVS